MKTPSIAELVKLIPPPPKPVSLPSRKVWKGVEERIGITFPRDYYDLAATYGSGLFRHRPTLDFLFLWNPAAQWYVKSLREIHDLYRDLRLDSPEKFPYEIFPKQGGLFYLGSSENRIAIFFLTKGKPDKWPILVWRPDRSWETMNLRLVPLLVQLFSGALKTHFAGWPFAKDLAYTSIQFEQEKTTPNLHQVVVERNPIAIRSLVSSGADVNSIDRAGRTPLMVADDPKIIRLLLTLGANVNFTDKRGFTPLMSAIKLRLAPQALKSILRASPNVNSVDLTGWTPLMYAVEAENAEAVELLLQANADVNIRSNNNETALSLAAANPKIQKLLRAMGAVR